MIILQTKDVTLTLDSMQKIEFKTYIDDITKEVITRMLNALIRGAREDYRVSDGSFETYLGNYLEKHFDKVTVIDEELEQEEKNTLIY